MSGSLAKGRRVRSHLSTPVLSVSLVLHPGELHTHIPLAPLCTPACTPGNAELQLPVSSCPVILHLESAEHDLFLGGCFPVTLSGVGDLVRPFSPHVGIFCLQMAVGRDQLWGLILMA